MPVFLGNYLIGLREGLEAALVVSILVAYIVKRGDRSALTPVWAGVGVAVALSVAFAYGLHLLVDQEDHFRVQELTGGILSLIAVGLVTWMVFWMRSASRGIKAELEGKVAAAIDMGAGALFVVAFLSVGREGLETALFLSNNINHSIGSPALPVTGAVCGLLTAVVLGYLIYRGGLKLNLAVFFKWTGVGLIVIAAGVFGYGFHDLQEADVLPGLGAIALNPGRTLEGWDYYDSGDWIQTLIQGIFNITPTITWLQLIMWVLYLVPVLYLFLRPVKATPKPVAAQS
ncbi:MAG: iron uptake transporter permease EfeU [Streptosporangiaceae bacterium]